MILVLFFRHVVAKGEVVRRVECERCHGPFEYVLQREAALDTLPLPPLVRSAERIVRERVARKLSDGVDPHPCPACGWVQSAMVPELRRRFASSLRALGLAFALASAFLGVVCGVVGRWFRPDGVDVDWYGIAAASAAGCVLGLALMGLRRLLARLRYRAAGHDCGKPSRAPLARAA
jgi:hypothetical protein